MSEMQVQCPNCGQMLSITDDQRNIRLTCPICQKPFIVPGSSPVSPAGFPPAAGQQPQSSNKKLLLILLGVGLVLLLFLGIFIGGICVFRNSSLSGGNMSSLRANENKFYVSQAFVVGDYVKSIGGGKILIVADPAYKQDTRMKDFVAAMRKGSGGDVVFDTVELPPTNEEMAEPISERMTTKDFEAAIARHGDAQVVVSLIGLPRDILKNPRLLQNCRSGMGPKFILLSSDVPQLGKMIEAGFVTAAVTVSPKATFDEKPAPADEKAAFAVRYILVDKTNIAYNKGLFGE